ncbi:MAG: M18 family aminopeptidase [Bacilli bacterium]|nr:M18 family aminopeptidase [Bacilli bacterium]
MKHLTVEEFAKKVGLSARSIRNYCVQGRIEGAFQKGKTWLIPENAEKPERNGKDFLDKDELANAKELIDFINNSPNAFFAIDNVKKILLGAGYKEYFEHSPEKLNVGDKVFFIRNGTSLVALNIGEDTKPSFHVIAAHTDSPCFKIKPESDSKCDVYNKINLAPYGGMIASTWFDRPLSIAGRVVVDKGEEIEQTLIDLKDVTVMIPNLCIHFNREINSGYAYNMAVDLQAFISQEKSGAPLKELIAKRLKIAKEDIVNFDLYLYNKEEGLLWGADKEYISAPRLDDLECVFAGAKAFANSDNKNAINVLYLSDNEEVGSSSRQGADSDALKVILGRVCKDLGLDYEKSVANSFLISADNAHAVHPNKPGITDSDNKAYMNKGIAIKFNAAQTYTSDALSSAVFQKICDNVNVPYQFFTNRSDLRGGGTLGNILLSHISFSSVDIGLPQLAMHSSYETAGSKDLSYAIKAFKEFYEDSIDIEGNKYRITK